MPQAPPGYLDRVFDFTNVCRLLDVNATTLSTWVTFAKMHREFGAKRGGRRCYSNHETYVLALMVALHHAAMPVSPETVSRILSAAYTASTPIIPADETQIDVSRTDAAGVILYAGRIWKHVQEKLRELENE